MIPTLTSLLARPYTRAVHLNSAKVLLWGARPPRALFGAPSRRTLTRRPHSLARGFAVPYKKNSPLLICVHLRPFAGLPCSNGAQFSRQGGVWESAAVRCRFSTEHPSVTSRRKMNMAKQSLCHSSRGSKARSISALASPKVNERRAHEGRKARSTVLFLDRLFPNRLPSTSGERVGERGGLFGLYKRALSPPLAQRERESHTRPIFTAAYPFPDLSNFSKSSGRAVEGFGSD